MGLSLAPKIALTGMPLLQKMHPVSSVKSVAEAGMLYFKLKNFLGIAIEPLPPHVFLDHQGNNVFLYQLLKSGDYSRDLFASNNWHHPVRWMPKLKPGWRRMEFEEFLAWYGIKLPTGGTRT